jgi:Na+/H+ antiporter NhaC
VRKLQALMRGPRSAQVGIAALVSLADCATANNTVAIVVVGNVAKEMSRTYRIDPRKTASLLDIFSCVVQGFLPYGAQILSATALVNAYFGNGAITSLDLIPYVWYCWLLCAFGLLSVFLPFAEGSIRKNPWDWDIKR